MSSGPVTGFITRACLLGPSKEDKNPSQSVHSRGHPMLSKCANPSCTESFRYFGEGRLFRLEADPISRSYTLFPDSFQEEYFWLCPACAERCTLHLEEGGRVTAIPLPIPAKGKSHEFAMISRMDGMMLRSVTSVRTHPRKTA